MRKSQLSIIVISIVLCIAIGCSHVQENALGEMESLNLLGMEYGRVRSIVGNEIEIDTAKLIMGEEDENAYSPGGNMTEEDWEAYKAQLKTEGGAVLYEEHSADGLSMIVIAMSPERGNDAAGEKKEDDPQEIIREVFGGFEDSLEFEGDIDSLVVPASAKIEDTTKKELDLSAIKNNSIIGYEKGESGQIERICVFL